MADTELDVEEAGGLTSVIIAAVIATVVVTLVSVPLLGLNWTQALLTGALGGVVAAIAATLGGRHATA